MSVPDTVIALMRTLPPPGTVWPREHQLVFIQALDAVLANHYGLNTLMIWIGEDGDIHIAPRDEQSDAAGESK